MLQLAAYELLSDYNWVEIMDYLKYWNLLQTLKQTQIATRDARGPVVENVALSQVKTG